MECSWLSESHSWGVPLANQFGCFSKGWGYYAHKFEHYSFENFVMLTDFTYSQNYAYFKIHDLKNDY